MGISPFAVPLQQLPNAQRASAAAQCESKQGGALPPSSVNCTFGLMQGELSHETGDYQRLISSDSNSVRDAMLHQLGSFQQAGNPYQNHGADKRNND